MFIFFSISAVSIADDGSESRGNVLRNDWTWDIITQEFGTYGPVTVFKNLRAENRWTQNNKLNDPLDIMKHWSRNNLLRTFNPDSRKWHESLIVRGKIVFNRAVEYLISID